MKNFEHLNAASFEQATQELKSSKRGQPIAGGTDLLGTLKKNILPESPDLMVNLKTIPNASYGPGGQGGGGRSNHSFRGGV